jgi:hypothetical protein
MEIFGTFTIEIRASRLMIAIRKVFLPGTPISQYKMQLMLAFLKLPLYFVLAYTSHYL